MYPAVLQLRVLRTSDHAAGVVVERAHLGRVVLRLPGDVVLGSRRVHLSQISAQQTGFKNQRGKKFDVPRWRIGCGASAPFLINLRLAFLQRLKRAARVAIGQR